MPSVFFNAGDAMDDANFEHTTANGAILRLTKELTWMGEKQSGLEQDISQVDLRVPHKQGRQQLSVLLISVVKLPVSTQCASPRPCGAGWDMHHLCPPGQLRSQLGGKTASQSL